MIHKRQSLLVMLAVFFLLSVNLFAFDFSQIESKVAEFKLDNGLTILVLPRHDAPVASFVTHVNVGCADDPMSSMGMAHMFEHMAFKGTREIGTKDYKNEKKWMDEEDRIFELILAERTKGDRADQDKIAALKEELKTASDSALQYNVPNDYNDILKAEGGVGLNAGTSRDFTAYYLSMPSNRLELWMAMEADRFLNPVLRELFQEKDVVAEERRFRVESSPTGRLFQAEYVGLAFNAHPYGKCLIGEMNEIENYNRPDMLAQFEKYYVPRNMVIAIVGDVDPEEVHTFAKKYFGKLKDRPAPRPVMITETEPFGVRTTTLYENSQPLFVMGYHIPSNSHPDWIALDALSNYLGSGRTSAFNKKLVKEDKTAVSVSAFVGYPASKFSSLFSILCIPSNESSNAVNEDVILAEIEKVRNEPISEAELQKIKTQAKANFINQMDSNNGLANMLVMFQSRYEDWSQMFRALDKINALTVEDIQRVAQTYLDPDKRIAAYIEKPIVAEAEAEEDNGGNDDKN